MGIKYSNIKQTNLLTLKHNFHMNKVLRSALALALACAGMTASVHADTEFTSLFLKNAGFDDSSSWQGGNVAAGETSNCLPVANWNAEGSSWTAAAAFGYDTKGRVNDGKVPIANPSGTATGGALGISAGWGNTVKYWQNVSLPAGAYRIEFKAMNVLAGKTQMKASIILNGVAKEVATSFAYNSWETKTASFTLTEAVSNAELAISFMAYNASSNDNAKVFVDALAIYCPTVEAAIAEAERQWRSANVEIAKIGEATYINSQMGEANSLIVSVKTTAAGFMAYETNLAQAKTIIANALTVAQAVAQAEAAWRDADAFIKANAETEDFRTRLDAINQQLVSVKNTGEGFAAYSSIVAQAIADTEQVLKEAKLPSGEYYLKTTYNEQDYYFGPSNSWGTQASLVEHSVPWQLTMLSAGKYTLESVVSNGGTNYYFTGTYCDGPATDVYFTEQEDGTYLLSTGEGSNYIRVSSASGGANVPVVDNTGDAASALKWTVVSTAIAKIQKYDDITFLIKDADFGRNNRFSGAWTMEASNKNLSGGTVENRCAESWRSAFTLSQTIADLPAGFYTITAQAAVTEYTVTGANLPVVYANGSAVAFKPMTNGENSMDALSTSFANGMYEVVVPIELKEGESSITLGVRGTRTDTWCVWDNFGLKYMADDITDYNELPYTELKSALETVRTHFADAKTTIAGYDEFIQEESKAEIARIEVLLQADNVTEVEKDAQGNPVHDASGNEKTIVKQEVVAQKIEAAYVALKCAELREALMSEIEGIDAAVATLLQGATSRKSLNDASFNKMDEAFKELVKNWQNAYDKINNEYKGFDNSTDNICQAFLGELNTLYVDIDALRATIDGYKAAGTCQEHEAATLEVIATDQTQVGIILTRALNGYITEVTEANAAAYKQVTDDANAKKKAYTDAVVWVNGHYAAHHTAAAKDAQVLLFEIYDMLKQITEDAAAEFNRIESYNATKAKSENLPLQSFNSKPYMDRLKLDAVSVDRIKQIRDDLEATAAREHDAKIATYQAQYDAKAKELADLRGVIAAKGLNAADYTADIAAIEGDLMDVQPYLLSPVYNRLTMTFTRRKTFDDHITKWTVMGCTTADGAYVKLATLSTPYGSRTETLSRSFENISNYRYLRFYITETSRGDHFFGHMSEFQLLYNGKNLITQTSQFSTNVSVAYAGSGNFAALIDGDAETYWQSGETAAAANTVYLQVDLGATTAALKHTYVASPEAWQCAVADETTMKSLMDKVTADIKTLDTKIKVARGNQELQKLLNLVDAARTAMADATALEYQTAIEETLADHIQDINAKIEAIEAEATELNAAGKLLDAATYDGVAAEIGTATDEAAFEPEVIDVELKKGEGKSYDDATVNTLPAIKVGTGSDTGTAVINVPAGAKSVVFSAAAWKDSKDVELTVVCGETETSFAIPANDAVSGSSNAFTIEETDGMHVMLTFDAPTADATVLTVKANVNRFVVWNARALGEEPTLWANVNALTAAAANENCKLQLDAVVATLQANSKSAAAVAKKLGQSRSFTAVNNNIKKLATNGNNYYAAATIVANRDALWQTAAAIQQSIDDMLSLIYKTDLQNTVKNLKTTWNVAKATGNYDHDFDHSVNGGWNMDEAWNRIENEGKKINAATSYDEAAYIEEDNILKNLALIYSDYDAWVVQNTIVGDVNLDGVVTVTDVIQAVEYALNDAADMSKRTRYATDANGTGDINITDVVHIVDIALGSTYSVKDALVKDEAHASDDFIVVGAHEISLASANSYLGFQMDITADADADFRLGERLDGFQLFTRRIDANTVRVAVVSLDKKAVAAGEGAILTAVGGQMTAANNVQFTDMNMHTCWLNVVAATGIAGIQAGDDAAEVYNVAGARTNAFTRGVNIVRKADGTVRKVLVK